MCEEDARIVDQYVEATELLRGEVHGAAYRLGIRDLRLELHMSFAGQGGDDLRGCRGGAAVVHGHPITPGREGRGHRGSDPTRTSGHQHTPAHRPSSATPASSRSTSSSVVYGASPARTAPASPSPIHRDASIA